MSVRAVERDVVVIGAGVVGAAISRELCRRGATCTLLEAAADVGAGTSKANTALLHTGFDAKPGTLEARLVRRGHELLRSHAPRAGIPLALTGALLVAWNEDELNRFEGIVARAQANGYGAIREFGGDELHRREPALGDGALGALEVPDEGILCPFTTTLAFATEALALGCELRRSAPVVAIERRGDGFLVRTPQGSIAASSVVNAAGLRSDEIDRMLGHDRFMVTPRRGELMVFDKLARPLLSQIVLAVPTKTTKGVLIAPTVYGNVMLGPTAEDLDDKADTSSSVVGLDYLRGEGRRIVPALLDHEVTAVYAGLRAATEHGDYQLFVDDDRYACVGGIRSTGVSASMAIAEHVGEELAERGLALGEPTDAAPPRMPNIGELSPRPYESSAAIAASPDYGRLVCFCERVSVGEIEDALASPIPPADPDGLRRRTRALMGRCQGFYCGARVRSMLAGGDDGG